MVYSWVRQKVRVIARVKSHQGHGDVGVNWSMERGGNNSWIGVRRLYIVGIEAKAGRWARNALYTVRSVHCTLCLVHLVYFFVHCIQYTVNKMYNLTFSQWSSHTLLSVWFPWLQTYFCWRFRETIDAIISTRVFRNGNDQLVLLSYLTNQQKQ